MTNQERDLINQASYAANEAWSFLTDPANQNVGATVCELFRARKTLSELLAIKPRKSPAKKEG